MANSKRRCLNCKEYHSAEEGIKTGVGWFHSADCAAYYGLHKHLKQKAKKEKADHKERKEQVMTRAEWFDKLQKLVNQYALHVIGKDQPCCTCGKPRGSVKFDAGHCFSRGARQELRFELTNIHPQCSVNCNQHGSGMRAEYLEFIRNKYGQDHLDWLQGPHKGLKEQFPHYEDIKTEIARYRALIRDAGLTPRV